MMKFLFDSILTSRDKNDLSWSAAQIEYSFSFG